MFNKKNPKPFFIKIYFKLIFPLIHKKIKKQVIRDLTQIYVNRSARLMNNNLSLEELHKDIFCLKFKIKYIKNLKENILYINYLWYLADYPYIFYLKRNVYKNYREDRDLVVGYNYNLNNYISKEMKYKQLHTYYFSNEMLKEILIKKNIVKDNTNQKLTRKEIREDFKYLLNNENF